MNVIEDLKAACPKEHAVIIDSGYRFEVHHGGVCKKCFDHLKHYGFDEYGDHISAKQSACAWVCLELGCRALVVEEYTGSEASISSVIRKLKEEKIKEQEDEWWLCSDKYRYDASIDALNKGTTIKAVTADSGDITLQLGDITFRPKTGTTFTSDEDTFIGYCGTIGREESMQYAIHKSIPQHYNTCSLGGEFKLKQALLDMLHEEGIGMNKVVEEYFDGASNEDMMMHIFFKAVKRTPLEERFRESDIKCIIGPLVEALLQKDEP